MNEVRRMNILKANREYYKTRRTAETDRPETRPSSPPVVVYHQQKFGITYHFAWVLGLEWGEKDNFEKSDIWMRDLGARCFAAPHMTFMGKNFVQYILLPALVWGHKVNPVYYDIKVNPDGSRVRFPANDQYHCVRCKLMATAKIMQEYACS